MKFDMGGQLVSYVRSAILTALGLDGKNALLTLPRCLKGLFCFIDSCPVL